jgi:heme/copper-type cytochrome/quinol oxidase subunit 3
MVLLIFTEATLFAILLTSYLYIRFRTSPVWPPPGIPKPALGLVLVMTPILLLSSAPMHWAARSIARGRVRELKTGLAATFVMGATFLGLQMVEFTRTLEDFTPRTDAYGSLFFTITGFHGVHVAVGLLMNLWLQWYAYRGRFSEERFGPVENIALYWHFVDAVWVFILFVVYLTPWIWP